MKKTKVLIVDDSELIRQMLTEIISSAPDLEVVGSAEHPYEARDKIKQLNPDVLTLDIEMPKMDGISFLRNLMRLRPMPVVMISTLTAKGAPATLDALEIGAVDYLEKPKGGAWDDLSTYSEIIKDKIRNAAGANMHARDSVSTSCAPESPKDMKFRFGTVICIGSSTGGTEALKEVLTRMPPNCPPIVMAQHIPASFSGTFAQRLNSSTPLTVFEAKAGMPLEPGHAYLAPGDLHLTVRERDGKLITGLFDGDKVSGHRPSVDVLFDSVAEVVNKRAVASILTGMGSDGAQGMKNILEAGGATLAQDEASSVVWGMPGAAVRLNAVQKVVSLKHMTASILNACAAT